MDMHTWFENEEFVDAFIFKWVWTNLHPIFAIISAQLNGFWYCYQTFKFYPKLINYLHTVKWLQVLLFNTNYSIQNHSFVCTQLTVATYH